ncbi:class I adenylate-forming enzyme family protein [Oceaniradius stylonematis]|jgi:long-chain acyl-CoA synthetase|uniref:class I adenylate-forming enzyme family protein n=1 Tax=Oceaniradius stylonematis TaxID=2184161 RepID=UPI00273E37DF|nr:class I adenylate-forming enzyme family protein [Oceaniradius stylonematis]
MNQQPLDLHGPLTGLLDRAAQSADANKPFMVVDGKPLTYGAFTDRVARLIALFGAKGLSRGDRAGIVTDDAAMAAALIVAALRAGVAIVNFNPAMTPPERANALAATDLAHLFIDRLMFDAGPLPAGLAHTIIEPDTGAGGLIGKLLMRGAKSAGPSGLAGELAAIEPAPMPTPVPADAIGLMLFTSGTTSAPKVVQLSHANLAAQLSTFFKVYDYDADSRILNPLPMHFTDGILHGPLIAFMTGATLYRPQRFNVQELGTLLDSVYRDRITHFNLVPAMLSLMDRLGEAYRDALATPDFRYIRSSGDRLPEALWRSVQERFGVKIINTYGLSETVCEALYCGPSDDTFRIGTIGKPVDCEIRLVGEDGKPAAPGEAGELMICGTNIMAGYLNRPDLTSDAIDGGGWFRTGDLATIDADGFVTITGRKKALIISGGANIQPQEIVDAMLTHEAVAEAHALGMPDPVWGERVVCAIVPRPGHEAPDQDALTAHARGLLSPNKVPRAFKVIEALPRNPAGKVLVDRLQALFGTDGATEGEAQSGSLEDRVMALAAQVFVCEPADLRLTSEPRSTFGWDSFAHLTLISEVERAFSVTLSARDVLRVTTLGHLVDILEQHRAGG